MSGTMVQLVLKLSVLLAALSHCHLRTSASAVDKKVRGVNPHPDLTTSKDDPNTINNLDNINNKPDKLVNWIRSKGGYWNPKQTMQHDELGILGVFATEPIQDDEVLVQIPWDAVITANTDRTNYQYKVNHDNNVKAPKRFDNCDTVKLLHELLHQHMDMDPATKSQSSNHFAVYLDSLLEKAQAHATLLPAYWSDQGKALLRLVVHDASQDVLLPPNDLFLDDLAWKKECEQISPIATLLVLTHGEDFGMSPVSDRFNSRGGNYAGAYFPNTIKTSSTPGTATNSSTIALEVRSWRSIQAGEQIYYDYHDYDHIGTPELLRDYGFVEQYPQRYIFPSMQIAFDIDVKYTQNDKDNKDNTEYTIGWFLFVEDERYFDPTVDHEHDVHHLKVMEWLVTQVERLQQLLPTLQEEGVRANVPKDEVETTIRFCHDILVAMEHALYDLHELYHEDVDDEYDLEDNEAGESDEEL